MVVPPGLRAHVLSSLDRQHPSASTVMVELFDAVENNVVRNKEDVKYFFSSRGIKVESRWVTSQCKILEEVWRFKGKSPDLSLALVDVVPEDVMEELVLAAPQPPQPIPVSMREFRSAMHSYWYNENELPHISTTTVMKTMVFDRNDLYRTNYSALEEMCLETWTVMIILLSSCCGKKIKEYVTWCFSHQSTKFTEQVNDGVVLCNEYVNQVLEAGNRFSGHVLVDCVGHVNVRNVDDFLLLLESNVDTCGCRHPVGCNAAEVPHLMHRTLRILGGNVEAMTSICKWENTRKLFLRGVEELKQGVSELEMKMVRINTLSSEDSELWETVQKQACKWIDEVLRKREGVTEIYSDLNRVRKQAYMCVLNAIGNCFARGEAHNELTVMRVKLQVEEALNIEAENVQLQMWEMRVSEKGKALMSLQMWDGHGSPPNFTEQDVQEAYKSMQRLHHPDKNLNRVSELPEKFQNARNVLLGTKNK